MQSVSPNIFIVIIYLLWTNKYLKIFVTKQNVNNNLQLLYIYQHANNEARKT